eukprot:CAMPEP_0114603552 /NCGR_PEP_ID=MMETSP0168-20121206/83_1 /TAXON_ID=95228 ORGANISM="Vannella sp., Strain DIVA3 517/6/12" /NCGR_SAMPLE_ID=MMETSP0168 /ASSEMBLY_ACC=CAM_ASM_000044 /LENGTH=243 /DNA_ID=CAMNT_0001814345 /DNA_START=8 /DNA_END=740 /DNA_ORIENTATION=+
MTGLASPCLPLVLGLAILIARFDSSGSPCAQVSCVDSVCLTSPAPNGFSTCCTNKDDCPERPCTEPFCDPVTLGCFYTRVSHCTISEPADLSPSSASFSSSSSTTPLDFSDPVRGSHYEEFYSALRSAGNDYYTLSQVSEVSEFISDFLRVFSLAVKYSYSVHGWKVSEITEPISTSFLADVLANDPRMQGDKRYLIYEAYNDNTEEIASSEPLLYLQSPANGSSASSNCLFFSMLIVALVLV